MDVTLRAVAWAYEGVLMTQCVGCAHQGVRRV